MANKQTPIDYIKDNLFYPIQLNQLKRVLNEAEQMHKEQIIDAAQGNRVAGGIDENGYFKLVEITGEDYYNETYGNGQNLTQ